MKPFTTQKYLAFSLKDKEYTASKWQAYQPRGEKYIDILASLDTEYTILDDINIDKLNYGAKGNLYFHTLLSNKYDMQPKSLAKAIHSHINQLAFMYHINAFKNLHLTDSQAKGCAIRFYLENYTAINNKLANLMEEALLKTPYASLYFPNA